MEFKFSNGGMLDDGMDIEPSTGNEIPPGSLSEEVADKVDAKLSPGEYVLPADVVQFYGLEKIEKLVEKAKKGLGDLEANDRIKSPQDEEELPFGDTELLAEEESGEEPSFAAGGFLGGGPNSGVQTINYVGPNGETMPVLFINGMPIQAIPQGYAPEGQNPTAPAEATPEFKSNRKKGLIPSTSDDRDDGRTRADPRHTNPELWDTDYFEKYLDQEGVTKAMTAVMGMVAPPIGAAMRSGYRRTGEKALEELDRRLASEEVDEASKERLRAVREQYESLGEGKDERGGFLGLPDKGIVGSLLDGENPFAGMFSTKRAQQETADRVNPAEATPSTSSTGSAYVSKPGASSERSSSDSRSFKPPSNFKSGSSSDDRTYSSGKDPGPKQAQKGAYSSGRDPGPKRTQAAANTYSSGKDPGPKRAQSTTKPKETVTRQNASRYTSAADGGFIAPRKKKK